MKFWRKSLLVVGLYLLFLVITFPAHWASVALSFLTQQRIQLSAAEGTLWQGKSDALQVGQYTVRHFSWHLKPIALLWGMAQADVAWGETSQATVSAGWHRVKLQHADIHLPVEWLRDFIPAVQVYGLGGEVRVQTDDLLWHDQLSGNAKLEWNHASTLRLPVQPLGDYQIDVQSKEQGIILQISTLRGALAVSGTGRWAAHDRFRFSGALKPDPARQAEFNSLIQLTGGQPDAQGAYRLAF